MKGRYPFASLVAALCALALVACGGDGDDGTDVDALTGCLEDAGLKVDAGDVGDDEASKGITDELTVKPADYDPLTDGPPPVQLAVFESSDQAQKYRADFSGDLKQVGTALIFSLDTSAKEYDQTVSCAQESS